MLFRCTGATNSKINLEKESKQMGTGSYTFNFTPTNIKGYAITFVNFDGLGTLEIQTKQGSQWTTKKTLSFSSRTGYQDCFFENGVFEGVRAILKITNQYAASNISYISCAYI